jgi:hypothetical protein
MTLKRKPGFEDRPVSAILGKSASAPAGSKPESSEQADRPPLLKIVITGDNHWEFPWSTLYSVHFEKGVETGENGEKIDRILLQYIRCEAILKGINLRKYEKPIHDESLAEICVVHGDYRKAELNKDHPVLTSVEIKPLAG